MIYHPQLDEVTDLARAFPETHIVLDHIGAPIGIGVYAGRRAEEFPGRARSLRELARCDNVFVKIGGMAQRVSGLGFHALPEPPRSEMLAEVWRPYVEACIASFGPDAACSRATFPSTKPRIPTQRFGMLASGWRAERGRGRKRTSSMLRPAASTDSNSRKTWLPKTTRRPAEGRRIDAASLSAETAIGIGRETTPCDYGMAREMCRSRVRPFPTDAHCRDGE